ncbi:hypothetical protein Lal_00006209 [Lupinus albus]|nr:hypothetical protein Lal_00006209 [Lupinus albus]
MSAAEEEKEVESHQKQNMVKPMAATRGYGMKECDYAIDLVVLPLLVMMLAVFLGKQMKEGDISSFQLWVSTFCSKR